MKKILSLLFHISIAFGCNNGVDDEPLPSVMADFTTTSTTVETGTIVSFTNNSINATSYSWVFNGGEPSMSTDENPTVTYNSEGTFSVSLTAINASETDTETKINYIIVDDAHKATEATYNVTFVGNWSAANHPTDFPAGDHFSTATGMVHKQGAAFFEEGALASEGVEVMAETGANASLLSEIDVLVGSGMALSSIDGEGLVTGFSEASFQITVTDEFPLVTLVGMIAPSPDWFVAVENVELFASGDFVENITVDSISYDSGTDDGATFTSADVDSDPAQNIAVITAAPLGNGTTVDPPVAMFIFDRVDN